MRVYSYQVIEKILLWFENKKPSTYIYIYIKKMTWSKWSLQSYQIYMLLKLVISITSYFMLLKKVNIQTMVHIANPWPNVKTKHIFFIPALLFPCVVHRERTQASHLCIHAALLKIFYSKWMQNIQRLFNNSGWRLNLNITI